MWLLAFIGSIVVANYATSVFGLVPIGFGLAVTAGTFAAGAALILRDGLQVAAGRKWAVAAVVVGALLSYVLAEPFIAIASGIAFLVSELVDFAVFTPLRERSLPRAVLVSSVVSAPVDTVLFLHIAGFGVTWQAVLGQFIVKTVMALAAAGYLVWRRS
jgi:uncharacterized PurR-regulated membrane protein YhhQ (DUF165 family)